MLVAVFSRCFDDLLHNDNTPKLVCGTLGVKLVWGIVVDEAKNCGRRRDLSIFSPLTYIYVRSKVSVPNVPTKFHCDTLKTE